MELLARERAAEQNVHYYLKAPNEPIVNLLQAFEEHRQASQAAILADFEGEAAQQRARVLWHLHTEGKKYFHTALSGLRKQPGQHHVALRQLMKFYLQFLKDSLRFYRDYIYHLGATFGGIPELEAVANQVKTTTTTATDAAVAGESSQQHAAVVSPTLREKVLHACHQALICLGDLSRYRAAEKLDKNPDFGPAMGYYGLACTLLPASGMGYHQLAVVALAQAQHLRTIYHLYRAIVVADPHPLAPKNLKIEFDKTNTAWEKGELIQKGSPSDPNASKRTLVGWFVRLHSMCFDGEPFKGFNELESEVLGQLAAEIKLRSLGSSLLRMVMVNLAAQYNATENFKVNPTQQNQNAFIQFFRINIKTLTTVLRVFHEELSGVEITTVEEEGDVELASRLSEVARSILPAMRLYSTWLLSTVHLVAGLSAEELLKEAIDHFWRHYARTVDLVAAVFPIWDLEDLPEIAYLLEEDADTVGFKPLMHERTTKIWYVGQSDTLKPRFSDQGITQVMVGEEMLERVKQFLIDGLFLANDDDNAPIKLRGTRILHRDAEDVETLPVPVPKEAPVPKPAPKTLSYAAAAANGAAQALKPSTRANGTADKGESLAQHAKLSRMVDDLVDDDDTNDPITPPQQHASQPAVVTRSDVTYSSRSSSGQDFAQVPNYAHHAKQLPIGTPATAPSPTPRTPQTAMAGRHIDRMQSLSSLWNDTAAHQISSFPSGLTTGTLASPAQLYGGGHSRGNSASSIRSRASQTMNGNVADAWSTLDSATRATAPGAITTTFGNGFGGFDQPQLASPLLFGAGGSVWSTRALSGGRNGTPPSGQGG